jgi:hypothetical protein
LLRQQKGIYAFETAFGEPVIATFYFDNSLISPEAINKLIEMKSITLGEGDESQTFDADFEVATLDQKGPTSMLVEDYIQGLFTPYQKTFNDFETLDSTKLLIYQVPFQQCLIPEVKDMVPYLRNHMMADKGIVKFETVVIGKNAFLRLYYVAGKTTEQAIFLSLTKPKLSLTYKDGETGEEDNPFTFTEKGTTITK